MYTFSALVGFQALVAAAASNECAKDGSVCAHGEAAGESSLLQGKGIGNAASHLAADQQFFGPRSGYCKKIDGTGVEKPPGHFSPSGLGQKIFSAPQSAETLYALCEEACLETDGCKGFVIAPGVHTRCNLFSEAPDYTDVANDQRWQCYTSGPWNPCLEECVPSARTWDEKCTWSKKCAGCRECAAVAEEHKCHSWCETNPKPWETKCTWHTSCSKCQECDDLDQLCGPWCPDYPESWEKKCTWSKKCGGCEQCGESKGELLQSKGSDKASSADEAKKADLKFVGPRSGYCKKIDGTGVEKPPGHFSPSGLGQQDFNKSEDADALYAACEQACLEMDGCKGFVIAPGVHTKCNLFSEAPDYTDVASDQRWQCYTSGQWNPCREECVPSARTWNEKCTWSKKCAGCPECAAVAEYSRCETWCQTNPKPWETKCTWDKSCSECMQCDDLDMLCGPWCGDHPEDWEKKCTWTRKCGGCESCTQFFGP